MALPKKAIAILRQVKRLILAEPTMYDQNEFPSAMRGHTCNTPACVAGWVDPQWRQVVTLPTTIIAAFLVATIAVTIWVAVDAVVKFWRKYR
jgi:hypothetical protein